MKTIVMSDLPISGKLSREEIAKREIGKTEISVGLSWLMTVTFLMTLVIPSATQFYLELNSAGTNRFPACLQIFRTLPEVVEVFEQNKGEKPLESSLAANRRLMREMEDYERHLESSSLLRQHLLAPTQYWLSANTGLGNEKVYLGRDGWLFYRPDVDYLTGPGFLDPEVLRRRAAAGKQFLAPIQPDPRRTIIEFHEQLTRRGIRLILMPIPDKASIHADQFSCRFKASDCPLRNASFEQFKAEMEAARVLVFDPAPDLAGRKDVAKPMGQYLKTDTHWTPDTMQFVAERLKRFIDRNCPLPPRDSLRFRENSHGIENLGDIAAMLRLPDTQTLYSPERVTIREITEPDGQRWTADETSDVLLLGDSYTNIYSLPEMKWGASAGLAEQISFVLHRRIDCLAQNDGGSHAVRQTLFQQLARGHDRLAGKRVVIWEFAVRELAFGDWKSFPMPVATDNGTQRTSPAEQGALLIDATVRAAAGTPQPGSVPYRDAVTGIHVDRVEALEGAFPNTEIVVYLWGMRDNQLLPAAGFAPGDRVRLRISRWDSVREKYERFNRIEPDDPDFKLAELPIYWAEDAR